MKMLTAAALFLTCAAAQAGVLNFYATLEPEGGGGRTGGGNVQVSFDDVSNVLSYSGSFFGLSGTTTAAHFHCCTPSAFTGTAGVAIDSPTLPIPLGVSAGVFAGSTDLDDPLSFTPAFVTASGGTAASATARFIQNIYAHQVYFNVHTSPNFGGGEIRGFLVPEPTSAALALLALGVLGAAGRKRQA